MQSAAIGNGQHYDDLLAPRCIGYRHGDRVEMVEGPMIIFVAQWHVEAGSTSDNLHVGRNDGFPTAHGSPHWLTQHRVNAGAAVLELTVDTNDRALAIRHRTLRQEANEVGQQLLAYRPTRLEQLGQVLNVPPCKRIAYDRHRHGANDWTISDVSHFRGDRIAQQQRFADVENEALTR